LDALVAATRAEFARAAYGADPRKTVAPFIEDKFRALCAEARQRYLANGAVVLAAAPEPDQRVARMGWFLRPLLLQDAAGKIVLDPEAPNGPTAIIRVI
jgi:acyl-CoA reductase-like NAD-dependent aldehyde dehydrogenase